MNVDQYLKRIDYHGPLDVNHSVLAALQLAHLRSVPFENLSIHWQQPIILDEAALFEKVVHDMRGGFCYELNGLFAWLLRELGFPVTLLSASVYSNSDERYGQPFDHLTLRVDLDRPYLVDVGFGDGFLEPLLLVEDVEQRQETKNFKLARVDEQWTYFERADADGSDPWQPRYRFTLAPRAFADFREMCYYQQTSPQSHFTEKIICTLATPNGRVTLSEDRFIITENGVRTERTVDEGEQDHLLREYFQISMTGDKNYDDSPEITPPIH